MIQDHQEEVRTRTISWENPMAGTQPGRTMSGLDYLKALYEGVLPPPPISALMDMRLAEVGAGRVVFSALPAEYHYNPLGTVHGGLAATLLDSALGSAIHSTLPAGTGYATLEIKINFLRPITHETGTVYCEGKVIHVGRRIGTAEGRVTDASGKLYAHATSTCIILHP
jgi:uncharacterized protein (TIGR00369 family)